MKKKNLLTLGALVLSLGLTVTSCAGAKGEDGAPGKDGTNGTNGTDGKDGKDGKTYIAVIVKDWKMGDNVKVSQDAYFIEPGESVTFTFEPASSSSKGDILLDLEINGEVKESVLEADDKGVVTYKVTTTASDKGLQLTGATYTSVSAYGSLLVGEHLQGLKEKDPLLLKGTSKNAEIDGTDDSKYDGAQWASSTFIPTNETTAVTSIATALAALDKDASTSTKVSTVKSEAEKANKKIDEAYATLLADAKTKAKDEVESVDTTTLGAETNYLAADKKALVEAAQASVEAATSLLEIAKVINNKKDDSVAVGSWNALVSAKKAAFDLVEDAWDTVVGSEADFGSEEEDALEDLEEDLSHWGVSLSTSPKSIYEAAIKEISAASSITVDSKGVPTAYKTKAEEIVASIQGLKDSLVKVISEQYYKEVTDSAKLLSNEKVTAKAKLEAAVSNFVNSDKDLSSSTSTNTYKVLSLYASQSAIYSTTADHSNDTLVGVLEHAMGEVDNDAFQAERLEAAQKEAISAFQAKLAEFKKDDTFAQIYKGKVKKSTVTGNATSADDYDYLSTPYIGLDNTVSSTTGEVTAHKDYAIANTLTGADGGNGVETGTYVKKNTATNGAVTYVVNGAAETNSIEYFEVNAEFAVQTATIDSLNGATATGGSLVDSTKITPTIIKNVKDQVLEDMDAKYSALVTTYSNAQKTNSIATVSNGDLSTESVAGTFKNHFVADGNNAGKLIISEKAGTNDTTKVLPDVYSNFVTKTSVEEKWEASLKGNKTLSTVSSVAKGTKSSISVLGELDTAFSTWLKGFGSYSNSASYSDSAFAGESSAWFTLIYTAANTASVSLGSATEDISLTYKSFMDELAGVINGTVTSNDIKTWASGLNSVYKSDVANWKEQTKTAVNRVYVNALTESSEVADSISLEKGYATWLAFLGSKVKVTYAATGSAVESFEVAKATDVTDSTNHILVLDFTGDTVTSINSWNTVMRLILGETAKGDATKLKVSNGALSAE